MDLNIKFISKFNDGVNDRGCLHYAILNALYGFKQKRAHKVREMQFFLQNIQKVIFKILKMCKNNTKFTKAECRMNSKIRNKDKNTTLVILFCHYCWSLFNRD